MSYNAVITELKNVRAHSNADRLLLADVCGTTVVVGLDHKDGDIGVYFPTDGKISDINYLTYNDLIPRYDDNGLKIGGGFFDPEKARVRAQRFRGEKSDGYWAPLDSLAYLDYDLSQLKIGDQFDTLNGIQICEKYFTPQTLRSMSKANRTVRKNLMFAKHADTEHLDRNAYKIEAGSVVTITEKLHGTSGRYCMAIEETQNKKKWYHKLFRKDAGITKTWELLVGTRNMVLNGIQKSDFLENSFYGKEEFRFNIAEKIMPGIQKGEVIYGELVGYTTDGTPIMGTQDTSTLKEAKKLYGKTVTYSYGEVPGNCEFYVYRITHVNEDGEAYDLSWPQVKRRCIEMNLKTVPEIYSGFIAAGNMMGIEYRNIEDGLIEIANRLIEGSSSLDSTHPKEGVVFRVDAPDGTTEFYKSKSFTFKVLEGIIKERDDYVDAEEIA